MTGREGDESGFDAPCGRTQLCRGGYRSSAAGGYTWEIVGLAVGLYYMTTAVVALGLVFGSEMVKRPGGNGEQAGISRFDNGFHGLLEACTRFDGGHYLTIAREGYEYQPGKRSLVAFFPAYPILTRMVRAITKLPTEAALLVASNLCLVVAFVLLALYARRRFPEIPPGHIAWVLLAFGLWPPTFFFRMAYSESMFVACGLVTLYGIARRWPAIAVGLTAGLATAIRPVGVAVSAACLWYVVQRPGKLGRRILNGVAVTPLAIWGILAYMAFQQVYFGNPLAFALTQRHWSFQVPKAYVEGWHKLA